MSTRVSIVFSIGTFLRAKTLQKRAYGAELQISKRQLLDIVR